MKKLINYLTRPYRILIFPSYWKIIMEVLEKKVAEEPLAFLILTHVWSHKNIIKDKYILHNVNPQTGLQLVLDQYSKQLKRRAYKREKREEMLNNMSKTQLLIYHDRVDNWFDYLQEQSDFAEAKAQFDNLKLK